MPSNSSRRRFLGVLSGLGVGASLRSRRTANSPENDALADRDRTDQPELAWWQTYGSSGNDAVVDVVPAHGGSGFLLAVNAGDVTAGAWVVRTDATGEVTWKRTYDFGDRDLSVALRRVSDGYVLAGYERGAPWLLRIAPDGRERWRRSYPEAGSGRGLNAMARTPNGGFVLAGSATRYEADREDVTWLLKTDAEGREQWARTYGDGFAWVTGVAPARDGGYALVGHSHLASPAGSQVDATLLGTDGEGREVWRRHYGGVDPERPQAILPTPTGFVFAGEADSPADSGGLLVAVDHRGRVIWRRVYPDLGVVRGLVALPDGYALVGDRLARTDRRGYPQWSFGRFGFVDPRVRALTRVPDGFVVGGSGGYTQDTGHQAWIAKIRTP